MAIHSWSESGFRIRPSLVQRALPLSMSGVGLPRGSCSREAGTGVQSMRDERANIFHAFTVFWIERFALESSFAVCDAEDHRGMPDIVDDDRTAGLRSPPATTST